MRTAGRRSYARQQEPLRAVPVQLFPALNALVATPIMHSPNKSSVPASAPDQMWMFPDSIASRRDLVRATLVEIGIATQGVRGTDRAAEYLQSQGIPLEIAVRVLSRPLQRRK